MITRHTVSTIERYLVSFYGTYHILHRKITLVRALEPIFILLKIKGMFALASKEINVHIPATAKFATCRSHLRGWLTLFRKNLKKAVRHNFILTGLHLAWSNTESGNIFPCSSPYGNPWLIPAYLLGNFFGSHV